MGGCEYLPSIQQVGLKVALRLFHKHKSVEEVVASLQKNKAFKERVPENYLEAVKRVQALFFFQTVYDSRTCELTSLEPIPDQVAKEIEPEFLGDRTVFAKDPKLLQKFACGLLNKSRLEERETYTHMVDMQILQEDFKMNSVTERSFICLDRSFFTNGFSEHLPGHQAS